MNKQPEALVLADALENWPDICVDLEASAAELRRLHEVNTELLEVLKLCKGNISSMLASSHPKIFGIWLDVVSAAIDKAEAK